jgi:hypothetical protein
MISYNRFRTLKAILIVLTMIALSGCGNRHAGTRGGPNKPPVDDSNIGLFMATRADTAVQEARDHYVISLDYSPDSIKQVDDILGKVHDQYVHSHDDKMMAHEATTWGAYLGEVIRRKYGGNWGVDEPKVDQPFPLHGLKSTSFPIAWAVKRIRNGDEDNVYIKYQLIVSPEYDKQILAYSKARHKSGSAKNQSHQ